MSPTSRLLSESSDRERMLDMDQRLGPVRRPAFAVLALALVVSAPWTGWWPVGLVAIAVVLFKGADLLRDRVSRPELAIFAAWIGSQVAIAVGVAAMGGLRAPVLAWFAIPVVTLSARYSARGIAAGVAVTLGLVVAMSFAVDPRDVVHDPPLLIDSLALVIAVALLSTALMRSDVEHRSEAAVDELTGLLNRKALAYRTGELEQQSAVSGEPVGLIVGDVDHFKRVNDSAGHAAGDALLREVTRVMRTRLRTFDLAYRLGGEEFLVLLPGADVERAAALAEQLRCAVAGEILAGGAQVTMSFGVAASARGAPFDYERVFAQADAALYEAKRRGRDRVCRAGADGEAGAPAAAA